MAYKGWLPTKREEQLAMAKNWLALMKQKGKLYWKFDDDLIADFEDYVTNAQDEFFRTPASRTVATNVNLKLAFEKLVASMRDVKKRYFFVPPLSEADLALLGLHLHDTNPTNIPAPHIQVTGELHCPGKGLVELKRIRPVGDTVDIRADYGVRVYYGILGASSQNDKFTISAPPITGDDLPHSIFTRQHKHLFDFVGDSGKQVFFCMRYENSKGQAGPWGNVLETFIS